MLVRIPGCSCELQAGIRKKKRVTVTPGISGFRGTSEVIRGDFLTPFSALICSVLAPSSGRASPHGGKMAARSATLHSGISQLLPRKHLFPVVPTKVVF